MIRTLLFFVITSLTLGADYGNLPLAFEPNMGQTDPQVLFVSRSQGMTVFLTASEAVMSLKDHVVRMKLVAAGAPRRTRGLEKLPGISNYFLGRDPKKWRTDIPNYGKVAFEGVYAGVDLVYRGNQRRLEYDFVVAPGANPDVIELAYEGADAVTVDPNGDLILRTSAGALHQERPRVYQEVDGRRVEIAGGYKVQGRRVGFALARYDASRPLVIDPVLAYATFLGGSGLDSGNAIAVDSSGSAYVAGTTASSNFPTQSPAQRRQTGQDVFVAKLMPGGDALAYATYLGGSGDDAAAGIAVDATGSACVTGSTTSANYPTQSAYQRSKNGFSDAFVTKLSPGGNALTYSTYVGGSGSQESHAIAVDRTGSAYITGWTSSVDFPTRSPYQTWQGVADVFVTKLAPDGSTLVYSTYLGGNGNDRGNGIAVDLSGSAYVTGSTDSVNYPVQSPYQVGQGLSDAFVTKLTPAGSALAYSTFLGGIGNDEGRAIAVDAQGSAYVTGWTTSSNYPTRTPYQALKGGEDIFVTKLAPGGGALVYSTYLGGSSDDIGNGIAVDASGAAYITGRTTSTNYPTLSPILGTLSGSALNDTIVTKLVPAGNVLAYSTYLGGTLDDGGTAIAVDVDGSAYVTGWANSPAYPLQSPYQTYQGGGDAHVTKIEGRHRASPRRRP
jgi:hypothetical protein